MVQYKVSKNFQKVQKYNLLQYIGETVETEWKGIFKCEKRGSALPVSQVLTEELFLQAYRRG